MQCWLLVLCVPSHSVGGARAAGLGGGGEEGNGVVEGMGNRLDRWVNELRAF